MLSEAPVYCVCALFTCFVCCHPVSETRQTIKFAWENKVQGSFRLPPPFNTPPSCPYALPHFPLPKGGSRNCPKTGLLFVGLELWRHHKPPGVLVLGRFPNLPSLSCGSVSSFTLVTVWKGATDPEPIPAPLPSSSWLLHSFLLSFSQTYVVGFSVRVMLVES